jgi:cytidylate kinase
MKKRDNMEEKKAFEIVKTRYEKNKKLYKKLYDFDFGEDMSVFDKIIDTDELDAKKVLEIAKSTVKGLL